MECSKGKKYSFQCPIIGYIVTGENTRGSTYIWVDRFAICMVAASYCLRGSESLLTVVPNRLVRHPNPDLLQVTKRVRFEWEHFLITVRRLLPHEVINTLNSGNVWLAITEIIISWERSQHFLLKGWNSGIEFMSWKCMWVCAKEITNLEWAHS